MEFKQLTLNKMKKILSLILILSGLTLTFYSCVNLDTEKGKSYFPDAYICSKIINGDTLYLVGGYVSANTPIKSVIMKSPDGSFSVDLNQVDSYGYYFERKLKDADFSSKKPVKGYYKFEIVNSDGSVSDTSNYVSDETLAPVKIEGVVPDSTNESITINWDKNSDASYYVVRLLRNDSIIYISNDIDTGYTSMILYSYSSGWASDIVLKSGDSLKVVISGVMEEITDSQYSEAQAASFSSPVGIVWPD